MVKIREKSYLNLAEAARAHRLDYHVVWKRVRAGWDLEQAVGLKPKPPKWSKYQESRERELKMGLRVCRVCKHEKPLEAFYENSNSVNGRVRQCRECEIKRVRSQRYGLSPEEHEKLLAKQGNKCAICKNDRPELPDYVGVKRNKLGKQVVDLAIDHCHESGKIRGLLCYTCNAGLGNFKDRPELLRAASMYLEKVTNG